MVKTFAQCMYEITLRLYQYEKSDAQRIKEQKLNSIRKDYLDTKRRVNGYHVEEIDLDVIRHFGYRERKLVDSIEADKEYWQLHTKPFINKKNGNAWNNAIRAARAINIDPKQQWLAKIFEEAMCGKFEHRLSSFEKEFIEEYKRLGFMIREGGTILDWWLP